MVKYWKMLIAMLAMAAMVMVPVSCSDDEDDSNKSATSLIGVWRGIGNREYSSSCGKITADNMNEFGYNEFKCTDLYHVYGSDGVLYSFNMKGDSLANIGKNEYVVKDNQLSSQNVGFIQKWICSSKAYSANEIINEVSKIQVENTRAGENGSNEFFIDGKKLYLFYYDERGDYPYVVVLEKVE